MKLQIGFDDFGQVKNNKYNFIDKTLFIKEVLDDCAQISVITRPRRFGKTFNLSTLHHFLAADVYGTITKDLFNDLNIAKVDNGKYMQYQGQYPVIALSFKNIKEESFANALIKFKLLIQELYRTHYYLKNSTKLNEQEQELFIKYISGDFNQPETENALYQLTELVSKHYGQKVWLLVDEYDTPIQAGYLNNHYNDIANLMRGVLSAALKNNRYLERSVITGILRIAKESLFSGLNNLCIYSILDIEYSQHFGFTQTEVHNLLQLAGLSNKEAEVKLWYNGYIFGGNIVYNPWSIVNYINKKGLLQAYWVNTSDDKLIRNLLLNSDAELKQQTTALLKGDTVIREIDENMVFGNLHDNELAVWSLLLMSGYLKVTSFIINDRGEKICHLAIPNQELQTMYQKMIENWLSNNDYSGAWFRNFLGSLLDGDIEKFRQDFGQVLVTTISSHDAARTPENFYHGFMLGVTSFLRPSEYEVKSNKESGFGRYDLLILPKDLAKYAIIFEFKSVVLAKIASDDPMSALEQSAQAALAQITKKQYLAEVQQRGYKNIIQIGLAFTNRNFSLAAIGGISYDYDE